jgi:signal transduction histidine kinase
MKNWLFLKLLKRLQIILFLIGNALFCNAQLQVNYNGTNIKDLVAGFSYTMVSSVNMSESQINTLNDAEWQLVKGSKLKLNRLSQTLVLKIPINQILLQGDFDYISINNPHVNFLKCWIVLKGQTLKSFILTGDNLPFNSRTIPVTNFDFPIKGVDFSGADIFILADKRYTNLSLPIDFQTKEAHANALQIQNLVWGTVIGIFFFIFLLNLFLASLLKLKLFLWYAILQASMIIYLLGDSGLSYKLFYPNIPTFNDLVRPFSLAFGIVPLILFFNLLMDLKNKLPKLLDFNKLVLLCYIPLYIIAIISASSGDYAIQGLWLQINKVLGPLLLLTLLIEAAYCYYCNIRYSIFALISYLGTTAFFVIYSLHQNELIPDNFFNSKSNYWGLIWELTVMSIALSFRYKYFQNETENLAKKNRLQQEQLFSGTVAFQEKEMQRFSSLLHDNIGANLGLLRLEADQMPLTEAGREQLASHITELGNEVRIMSHRLSPILLEEKGLYLAIEETVERIKRLGSTDIAFEWIGKRNTYNTQFAILIYRISQELLQNLIKHSHAKTAFLQIMVEDQLVSIYLEDDGIGFNLNEPLAGVGLKSIEKLTELLNGRFQIDSSPGEGFSISIEFNWSSNENI